MRRLILIFLILLSSLNTSFSANITTKDFIESLMIPGFLSASCCGQADAYLVKTFSKCNPIETKVAMNDPNSGPCMFTAILDKQPKAWYKYQHTHYPEGTRIYITKDRMYKHPPPNILGKPIVFTSAYMGGKAICYEPAPEY